MSKVENAESKDESRPSRQDLESVLFQGGGITMEDVKEHIGGPIISVALHAVILVLLATVFVSKPAPQKPPEIIVQAQEAEVVKPPEDEIEELEPPPDPIETDMVVTDLSPNRPTPNRTVSAEAVALTENVTTTENALDVDLSALTVTDSNSALKMSGLTAFGRAGDGKGGGKGGGGGMDAVARATMLQGVFYDLKQTPKKKPTDIGAMIVGQASWFEKQHQVPKLYQMTYEILGDFVSSEWKRNTINGNISYPFFQKKFFSPPIRLMNSCLYIPTIHATEAPKAFHCEKDVNPSTWVAIYGGRVIAPTTGKFRFVGSADDVLAVRFNGELVFDYGYSIASLRCGNNDGIKRAISKHDLSGLSPETLKLFKESPLFKEALPIRFPEGQWGQGVCGGKIFSVEKGKAYDIDILISEIPGGYFQGALFIEQVDPKIEYEKDNKGCPILPLFWTTKTTPNRATNMGGGIPYDRTGAVWRVRTGKSKPRKEAEDDISL